LWDPVRPILLRYVKPEDYRWLVAKGTATDMKEIYEEMESSYKVVFPDELPNVSYMDENMAETMDININIRKMFVFLGIIAAILSAIGLFSLVSLDIIKRMKEIGVRKVLGASTANIVKIINKRYIIILSIASVLGSILGYLMADMLMASIWSYYLPIGPMAFILSITLLVVIAMVTVGGKVIRAAQANPSTTLRDE
jgi:ABC-type antimicrobial peptide transport system permease subunit